MTMTQTLTDSLQVQEAIFRTLWPDSSSPTHTHACFLTLPHFYMGSDLQKMGFCTKPGAADWVACPALGFGPWLVAPAQSPAALPLLSHSCSLWEVRTKWEPVVSLPLKASQNPDRSNICRNSALPLFLSLFLAEMTYNQLKPLISCFPLPQE